MINDDDDEDRDVRPKNKQGIAKTLSLVKDVLYFPIRTWDAFFERVNDVFEDKKIGALLSNAVVIALNTILVLTAMNAFNNLFASVSLLIISVLNTFHFLTATKSYQLLRHTTEDLPRSTNIRTNVISLDGSEEHVQEVPELYTWNPSHLATQVFIYFSPLQVIIVLGSEGYRVPLIGTLAHFVLGALIAFTLYLVITKYQGLIRDKEIVFGEVYGEYNRFANKRLSVRKEDKAVQVGPLWSPYSTDSPQRLIPILPNNSSSSIINSQLPPSPHDKAIKRNAFQQKR